MSEDLDMNQKTEVRRDSAIAECHTDENAEFIKELQSILENMEDFCMSKISWFMPIRLGMVEANKEVQKMNGAVIYAKWHYGLIPLGVGWPFGKKLTEARQKANLKDTSHKGIQTEEAVAIPTPHYEKRVREPTLNPPETNTTRSQMKKQRTRTDAAATSTTKKEAGGVSLSLKRNEKKDSNKRAQPEAVLLKSAEGLSYAKVLKDLKRKVRSDTLSVQIRGVRQTRNGDVLIDVKVNTTKTTWN